MPRPLHIACLQTRPMPDFQSAMDEALPLAEAAVKAGANFICLPEYCGGLKSENGLFRPPAAPEADHPSLNAFRQFAADNSVWVLVGSVAVPGEGEKFLNRGFLLDDRGTVRARYDKIHLFDIQLSADEVYRESALVEPGGEAVLAKVPGGKLGMSTCYDLRFPHLYRSLAKAGADILAVPAAFTKKTGQAHWHVLNRARAIENGAFVVAPCATGPVEGGGEAYGHSLIINPWGEVITDGGEQPGFIHAEIDLDEAAAARGRIPALTHDRPFDLSDPERAKPQAAE
ncbi:MAG: carbon-nitrogen hydrolase family protein [Rhizobiaceae bacterium]